LKFNFTATHGVGIMSDGELVADFHRDLGSDTADGQKVYLFATDDVKVAGFVRATKGFGIVEAKAEPAAKTPTKP